MLCCVVLCCVVLLLCYVKKKSRMSAWTDTAFSPKHQFSSPDLRNIPLVLFSILIYHFYTASFKDLETLHDRTMDSALSVRKQAMVSITALLVENPGSSMLHR